MASITVTPAKRLPESPFTQVNITPLQTAKVWILRTPSRPTVRSGSYSALHHYTFLPEFGLPKIEPRHAIEFSLPTRAKATTEKKSIYVHIGASWCGWCKRLDAFLERPDVKPVFEKYFVPVKLVLQENDKNKALENAGADAWLKKVGGPEGLPFSAFLDSKGTMIVNSKPSSNTGPAGGNIGYPAGPEEIDWFVTMMKKAAPKIAADDLKVIETALRAQQK